MSLADLSFKLYTDSGLTTPFSGTYQLTHNVNLSDNPTDFVLYFGSTDSARQLQANSNPGVDAINLTPTNTLPEWDNATAYALGDLVEPTTPNGKVYKVTTAGTSHATTEPTWPTVGIGSTVSDGTVVWALQGNRHEITEIKLALTSGGLAGATGGGALNIGTTLTGGVVNAVQVNVRVTNAVTTVRNNTSHAEMAVFINEVVETEV